MEQHIHTFRVTSLTPAHVCVYVLSKFMWLSSVVSGSFPQPKNMWFTELLSLNAPQGVNTGPVMAWHPV